MPGDIAMKLLVKVLSLQQMGGALVEVTEPLHCHHMVAILSVLERTGVTTYQTSLRHHLGVVHCWKFPGLSLW